jgi:hypothetical protein
MKMQLVAIAGFATCIAATAQAQETRPRLETVRPMGSIEIPPEIAPAVVPYMMCLQQKMREAVQASNGLDQAEYTAAVPVVREKCAGVRRTALEQGVQMLADRRIGTAGERPARVEATLVNIDDFILNMTFPEPVEGAN